jgi:hypothetical protein
MPPSAGDANADPTTRSALRNWIALGFLAAMASIQGAALLQQFELGFVPFMTNPRRVPFSWDMFSIPIERCGITWDPPLPITARGLPSLRATAPALEWDPVYNAVPDYIAAARYGCSFQKAPTKVHVRCFTQHRVLDYAFDCP